MRLPHFSLQYGSRQREVFLHAFPFLHSALITPQSAITTVGQTSSLPSIGQRPVPLLYGELVAVRYVNLYLCARNPILYKRQSRHAELCVLRIDPRVLDLPGVVVTDGNAASAYVR